MARFDSVDLNRLAGDAAFAHGEAYVREGRVALVADDLPRISVPRIMREPTRAMARPAGRAGA